MSVINQMLNDLDNRKGRPIKQAHKLSAYPLTSHPDDNQTNWKWGLLASNILLIAAVCVFAYWYVNEQQYQGNQPESNLIPITLTTQIQSDDSHNVSLQPMNAYIDNDGNIPNKIDESVESEPENSRVRLKTDTNQKKIKNIELPKESSSLEALRTADKKNESKRASINTKKTPTAPKRDVVLAQNSQPVMKKPSQSKIESVPLQASTQFSIEEVHLSKKELSRKFYEEAELLKQQGLLIKALPKYQASLQSFSKNKDARQELATVLVTLGQYDEAMLVLQQGIELFPHDSIFSFSLVHLQGKLGLYDQAMSVLSEMNARGDELIRKHSLALSLAKKSNNLPLQRDSYRALSLLEPDQGRWWMGWAHILDKEGNKAQAILGYETALLKNNLSKEASIYIQNRLVELKGRQ